MSTNHVRPTKLCTKCNCLIANNNIKLHFEKCNGIPSHAVKKYNNIHAKERSKSINFLNLNWEEIQKFYNNNHTFKDVQLAYNLTANSLAKCVKMGLLKTRSAKETMRLRGTRKIPVMTQEMKEKISRGMRKAVLEGRQKTPKPYGTYGTTIHHTSWLKNDEILHARWELKVADFMDKQQIHWVKSKEHFTYIFEDKKHEYFPDFYLRDYDLYLEVKGQVTLKDLEKWKQFPKKLLIIDKKTINDLNNFFSNLATNSQSQKLHHNY